MLTSDLRNLAFRFSGEQRYASARAALVESSRNALADIGQRVGNGLLTRNERVTAVRIALERGNYVEIRGDAGVGKSGVLRLFAEQSAREGPIVVLSPGRTISKGWTALRGVLNFEGTARELLLDLAADGGAILFIDGLDFFDAEERLTVVDLLRGVVDVPGFGVIATARRNFGADEPNWLPADVLVRLGHTDPIVISELNEAELDELRSESPKLAALLDENHPARNVSRNLYYLNRLSSEKATDKIPHTEAEMAQQWWTTADGRDDSNRRDRARLLTALAAQAVSYSTPIDVGDHPSEVSTLWSRAKHCVISETIESHFVTMSSGNERSRI